MTDRKKLEALVWKHTHRDFKGRYADGTKTVLVYVPARGTTLQTLSSLTDEQLLAKLPAAVRATLA